MSDLMTIEAVEASIAKAKKSRLQDDDAFRAKVAAKLWENPETREKFSSIEVLDAYLSFLTPAHCRGAGPARAAGTRPRTLIRI